MNTCGSLYIVSTPIGNLSDISARAINTLNEVEVIFCEDTRVTKKLLNRYDIKTKMISYHSFSGDMKIQKAIEYLKNGLDVALVSDAGTPTISDPGSRFVNTIQKELKEDVNFFAIPGPSALVAALSVSGAPAAKFEFFGFLPRKKGRGTAIEKMCKSDVTVVFYESPKRILKTLLQMKEHLDKNKLISVSREITKINEKHHFGTIDVVIDEMNKDKYITKGELVVVISSLRQI